MHPTLAATTTEDDGLRVINLHAKQALFLVMAATTVLVVAFMLGMLVGRGVTAEREETVTAEALVARPPASVERLGSSTPDDADPRRAAPPTPAENGDSGTKTSKPSESVEEPPVAVRRDAPASSSKSADAAKAPTGSAKKAVAEAVKPPVAAPKASEPAAKPASADAAKSAADAAKRSADLAKVPAPVAKATPPPTPAPTPALAKPPVPPAAPAPVAAASAASTSERSGFAVQVAAVNVRTEADAIVKRLVGKGYSAYVEVPKGVASTFRVRVGTFETRHEAQGIADKLKKDENFKPWVTR